MRTVARRRTGGKTRARAPSPAERLAAALRRRLALWDLLGDMDAAGLVEAWRALERRGHRFYDGPAEVRLVDDDV